MKKPPARIPTDELNALTHHPFAKLQGNQGQPAPQPPLPAATPLPKAKPVPARAVVRFERKGRGGKEVTLIEQLALKPRDLEELVKNLKKSLGCGGMVEESRLVLQGDQCDRVVTWLTGYGVGRVIRGT